MKGKAKLFYLGIAGLLLFELANVYFIMPMPGSQEINSIGLAYFLYTWRWVFRVLFVAMVVLGLRSALRRNRWLPYAALLLVIGIAYGTNFKMAADTMFYQPTKLQLTNAAQNTVAPDRLVLGITYKGQAKAYPVQYLGYHHQVRDSIGGKPVMVTYCTVCRTGRVFEPVVNGKPENFRLVGMDHFNAMFEDETTGSWWRQATGQAVAGKLAGHTLPEYPSMQTTLTKWLELHPQTLIMQPDKKFQAEYDSLKTYEKGRLTGTLTRRDTSSWQPKSWVVGVSLGNDSKSYDWNRLQQERIIYDVVHGQPIAVILSEDKSSFVVLARENREQAFTLQNDTLISQGNRYSFFGKSLDAAQPDLKSVTAYQEYWHSWKTFHPMTKW
ncbi:DUF3179 domain-containing (seleno)protein [Pontibacter liquoris]|uniref:DUF3179 domain-containing (seleno)protein n=1 Tax=Pontibacter liquoris TaxID=2905677 RepID=UPI001FA70CEB|nr:DUF3179 domain-containing (seleno)protein [Pontibacter liquoris]